MADIINLKAWREATAAAAATDLLHGVLSLAAEACVDGGLSAEDRTELAHALLRTSLIFDDCVGYSISLDGKRDRIPKPDHVLHKGLCIAAEEAAARILSAEGRAILINAMLIALGSGWRIDRAA